MAKVKKNAIFVFAGISHTITESACIRYFYKLKCFISFHPSGTFYPFDSRSGVIGRPSRGSAPRPRTSQPWVRSRRSREKPCRGGLFLTFLIASRQYNHYFMLYLRQGVNHLWIDQKRVIRQISPPKKVAPQSRGEHDSSGRYRINGPGKRAIDTDV